MKINERRRAHGLEPLARNATLGAIARSHAEDMLANGYFDHTAPDGGTRADRYRRGGYQCRVSINETHALTGAENLYRTSYYGQELSVDRLARKTVNGWMNSTTHREQILQPAWTTEGIGVTIGNRDGKTVVYVVQNFC